MEEQRTFKIINLTGLDSKESEDIVEILNQFMNRRNMESGKKAVESLIRDYKYKMESYERDIKQYKKELEAAERERLTNFDILVKHVSVTTSLKELINNLKLV